jgi:hypothetical protein
MMDYDRETEEQRVERAEAAREYLLARTEIDERSGCWVWQPDSRDGAYGKGSFNGYTWRTHRLAFHYLVRYLHRKVPVHHRCGVALCCNPDHLQMTTQQDNAAEMLARVGLIEEIEALRDQVQSLQEQLREAKEANI